MNTFFKKMYNYRAFSLTWSSALQLYLNKKKFLYKATTVRLATLRPNELNRDVGRFTTHVVGCLASNQVVASCVNTFFLLDKITRESRHGRYLRHLLQNKFASGQSWIIERLDRKLMSRGLILIADWLVRAPRWRWMVPS